MRKINITEAKCKLSFPWESDPKVSDGGGIFIRTDLRGYEICYVCQYVGGVAIGWYYFSFSYYFDVSESISNPSSTPSETYDTPEAAMEAVDAKLKAAGFRFIPARLNVMK